MSRKLQSEKRPRQYNNGSNKHHTQDVFIAYGGRESEINSNYKACATISILG
ncbi:MAG: hypothetical protein Cpurp_09610 [Chlorogloea purpurea SAG 13.99]|nr:hypothetical protein [Chlorogloea purpurea SAG 13.99]